MHGREQFKTHFWWGIEIWGFNQIKKFFSKLLYKISFFNFSKKKFGIRCTLTSPHQTSLGQVVHKFTTLCRQPVQLASAVDTLLQLLHPAFSLSFSAVLLHFALGLPCLWCPSGVYVITILQSLLYTFLIMCGLPSPPSNILTEVFYFIFHYSFIHRDAGSHPPVHPACEIKTSMSSNQILKLQLRLHVAGTVFKYDWYRPNWNIIMKRLQIMLDNNSYSEFRHSSI